MAINTLNFTSLKEPIPITEQIWPEGTLPIVSVGVTTFNHEKFIRDCIEGILMQKTTFPVRICIFEDCSTDNTRAIIKEYSDKYPSLFFTFFQEENSYGKPNRREKLAPYFQCRNEAKYIALCEGDDYWTDSLKLEKQVKVFEVNPSIGFCVTKVKGILDKSGKEIKIRELVNPNKKNIFTFKDYLKMRFSQTSSFMFKTALYDNNILQSYYCGDQALVLNIALKGDIYYINEFTSVYRINENSVSFTQAPEKIKTSLKKFYKEIDQLTNGKFRDIIYLQNLYLNIEVKNRYLKKVKNGLFVLFLKFI